MKIFIPNPLINCSILILKSRIGFGHYLMELVLLLLSDKENYSGD